jgi:hypothetical protein
LHLNALLLEVLHLHGILGMLVLQVFPECKVLLLELLQAVLQGFYLCGGLCQGEGRLFLGFLELLLQARDRVVLMVVRRPKLHARVLGGFHGAYHLLMLLVAFLYLSLEVAYLHLQELNLLLFERTVFFVFVLLRLRLLHQLPARLL